VIGRVTHLDSCLDTLCFTLGAIRPPLCVDATSAMLFSESKREEEEEGEKRAVCKFPSTTCSCLSCAVRPMIMLSVIHVPFDCLCQHAYAMPIRHDCLL